MPNKRIFALHGFLGLPTDWNAFPDFNPVNLYETNPICALQDWAKQFNEGIKGEGYIIIGYSLGGRLALHALVDNPAKWKAAVIISANPGLPSEEEKQKRLQADEIWAKRFESETWETLIADWNKQDVFQGRDPIPREEQNYDRQTLAAILRTWSLGRQQDLAPSLSQLKIPTLWIAGEKDKKYVDIANKQQTWARVWIAPNVGHRLPWEDTKRFKIQVAQFLEEMK